MFRVSAENIIGVGTPLESGLPITTRDPVCKWTNAIRLLLYVPLHTGLSPYYRKHRILKVKELYDFEVSKVVQKHFSTSFPHVFYDFFLPVEDVHSHHNKYYDMLNPSFVIHYYGISVTCFMIDFKIVYWIYCFHHSNTVALLSSDIHSSFSDCY